jgi:hypothetical protein
MTNLRRASAEASAVEVDANRIEALYSAAALCLLPVPMAYDAARHADDRVVSPQVPEVCVERDLETIAGSRRLLNVRGVKISNLRDAGGI